MLVYFKVGNYKSIKDPVLINFNSVAINEHSQTNVYDDGKINLLKSIVLYGPNASGKSKILDAFVFFRKLILRSASDGHSRDIIETESFRLNNFTKNQPSFFEAEFLIGKKRYRYGFEVNTEHVQKEWLLEIKATTQKPVFLRIEQEFEINEKSVPDAGGLEGRTRKNALFLSVADQWNVALAERIIKWFDSIYTIDGLKEKAFKSVTTKMLKNKLYTSLINSLVNKADLGISGLEVVDGASEYQYLRSLNSSYEFDSHTDEKNQNDINAIHEVLDDNGNFIEKVRFSLEKMESEGTQKFYNLTGVFLEAIIEGRLVIIDEFDARMHTMLSTAILHLFNSRDFKSKAQLLAACHDTALLDKDLLRRDQIYFVEKNQLRSTTVTNLVEYKARKETPFQKNYLEGKYGAIPFIENLESIISDGEETE